MNDKLLSLIIPVYNSEKYIIKCLNSIIPYMNDNTELIIIDDCSKDDSLKLLNNYITKSKNKNITLLKNKSNIGAGLSRNEGLKIATGKYIGFIDSDDYVDKNYFNIMLKTAEKMNSDIVVSDISLVSEQGEEQGNIYKNNIFCNKYNNSKTISKELVLGNWACASTCNKIFKKELIKNLEFSEKSSDDLMFSIPAILEASTISYCENNKYYYYQSNNSVTRNLNYKTYKENLECLAKVTEFIYKKDKNLAKIYAANCFITNICYSLDTISLVNLDDYLNLIFKVLKNDTYRLDLIKNNQYLINSRVYKNKKYQKRINNLSLLNINQIKNSIILEEEITDLRKSIMTNENFSPRVTIVIPVYNGENYVEEAINSALSQTYKNIEILVVNDGSKDNTEKICMKYKDKIKYIKKENGGVASALNVAIDNMSGEYFSWLSHDDLYFEDKIEKQVNFLSHQKNKQVILFSNYILINENGRKLANIKINPHVYKNKKEYILLRGCINGITMLIPKKAFLECGKFNESLRCTQDYDCWHRLLKKYDFIQVDDYLSKTRVHSLQDTVSNPKAISEGEKLWHFMIEDVDDKRKIELEGSLYNYYYKMALHLRFSPYKETIEYCINKCKEINNKKYNKCPITIKSDGNLNKVIYCIKEYGLIETIKIVIKKILRR